MKIDHKILSIPPYISTDWSQVRAVFVKDGTLCVALVEGDTIDVPGLSQDEITKIFESHAEFVEEMYKESSSSASDSQQPAFPFPFPTPSDQNDQSSIQMSFGPNGESWGNVMHHNPEQSHLPNLPSEIIEKITNITKVIIPSEVISLAKAEPHCNCIHCQIVRAMNGNATESSEAIDELEDISDEELKFSQWDVQEVNEKIFTVTNKLDQNESYQVCLKPIGCTCGKSNCEHIITVLES